MEPPLIAAENLAIRADGEVAAAVASMEPPLIGEKEVQSRSRAEEARGSSERIARYANGARTGTADRGGAAGFARFVAIKRAHERFARDPDFVAMFLDEARLVARIHHPNVVQTIDVVAENDELFIVMEYVHGESLLRLAQSARQRGERVPIPICAAILVGALHGLHEAHEARSETGVPLGIVHRDVSPHNFLVGADGVPRVLDFGVAKASERITTTQEGQLKGKLSYMAPEQVANAPVDRRTDVYAAAVVLWEALTGTKLFQGANEAAVLQGVMLAPVEPPSRKNAAVAAALDDVVTRGLAREPAQRFATARDMALAIERAAPVATTSEVGAFVSSLCAASLAARKELIASIEAKTSSSNLRDAVDSLRALSTGSGRRSASSSRLSAVGPGGLGAPFGSMPSARPEAEAPGASHAPPLAVPVPSWTPPMHDVTPHAARVATYPPDGALGGKDGSNAAMHVPTVASISTRALAIVAAIGGVLLGLAVLGAALVFRAKTRANAAALAASGAAAEADSASSSGSSAAAGAAAAAPSASAAAGAAATPTCPDGMVFVPGGRFFMGSDDDRPDEKPAHKVTLGAFCMDRLEVTTEAYKSCSDRGDRKRAGTSNRWGGMTASESRAYDPLCNVTDVSRGKHPINCVDWSMADRFCKAEGKRLPTEAELLNACGKECVAWGRRHAQPLDGMYADDDGFPTTAPVGSFPLGASRWGVEDVVGNVWEWTSDFYGPYAEGDVENPTGPAAGATRVIRGGAWNGAQPDWVRPAFRFHDASETRSYGIGFRCAKAI